MSGEIHKLGMPKWGLSMTEGRLVEWLVQEGAELTVGADLAEVETEKINGVVESPAAGVLRRRVAVEGDVVPVGGLLGVIAEAEVPDAEIDAFVAEFEATFVPGEEEEEAGPEPETVVLDFGTLRFLRQGEGGEPLVLLHGFGGDLGNWLFAMPVLAAERAVYALDLPGHGGSSKDIPAGDPAGLAATVEQFLDSQGLDRVHLGGHSVGGLVAAKIAIARPDRIASLILVASAGLGREINRDYIEGFIAAGTRRELKPVLELLFDDRSLLTRQLVDDVLRYKRIDGVQQALRTIADAAFDDGQRELVADSLAELTIPMLVLWGAEDRIIPAGHSAHAPERADVHVFEACGHSPHMERAGEFNRAVEGFVAKVGSAGSPH
jgi:pyruvate dehydrogenase E2 component (dihydrolipoamide acetyltransferase)